MNEEQKGMRTFESATYPDVRITIRLGREHAGEFSQLVGRYRQKEMELEAQIGSIVARNLIPEARGPKSRPGKALLSPSVEDSHEIDRLACELFVLRHGEINPAILRWGLVSIENFMIDEQPATADLLIESGPDELNYELLDAILGSRLQKTASVVM